MQKRAPLYGHVTLALSLSVWGCSSTDTPGLGAAGSANMPSAGGSAGSSGVGGVSSASGGLVSVAGAIATGGGATNGGGTSTQVAGTSAGGGDTAQSGGRNSGGAGAGGANTNGGNPTRGGSSNASGNDAGGRSSGGAPSTSGGRTNGGTSSLGGSSAGGASAGSTASGGAPPQTGLPSGVRALFPANGAQGSCPDPVLRITFESAPTLGNSGKIQVFNASDNSVASVDMAASTVTDTLGGTQISLQRTVYLEGNTVAIYLRNRALPYGQSYYVTVDAGAIKPAGGGSFSLSGNTAWRFSTAAAAPSSFSQVSVALDGTGQFCSVQGAFDAFPNNNQTPSVINVKRGTYHEVIHFRGKNNVTLRGEDRRGTRIEGVNNNNMNGGTATRALFGVDASTSFAVENLTIQNLTPQGGSQAEALRMQNCDKCMVRDADILSLQDTLLWSGRIYAKNCYIAGNVDYIWGTGAVYFDQCEIHTLGRKGYNVQSRNAASGYGYVFVDSKLTADAGITGDVLARIDVSEYPGSHVAYINCTLGSHIAPSGWVITGGSPGSSLRFWEYQSKDASGNLVNTSQRAAGSTQISASQAAMMRDPSVVLGGWKPPTQ
ncbi:MAG TPA: pectinesterase family protein [Polyangiaceae bacterium]|nr:pectinesterase family protein [Polyangiaceae bacterium]